MCKVSRVSRAGESEGEGSNYFFSLKARGVVA